MITNKKQANAIKDETMIHDYYIKFCEFTKKRLKKKYPACAWYVDPHFCATYCYTYYYDDRISIALVLIINGAEVYAEVFLSKTEIKGIENKKEWGDIVDNITPKVLNKAFNVFFEDQSEHIINVYGKKCLKDLQSVQCNKDICEILKNQSFYNKDKQQK